MFIGTTQGCPQADHQPPASRHSVPRPSGCDAQYPEQRRGIHRSARGRAARLLAEVGDVSVTESRMLRCSPMRASRALGSVLPLSPKIRSKTVEVVFQRERRRRLLHAIVFEYEQAKPTSQEPETSRRPGQAQAMRAANADAFVRDTLVIETPAREPAVPMAWRQSVRNRVGAVRGNRVPRPAVQSAHHEQAFSEGSSAFRVGVSSRGRLWAVSSAS